MLFLSFLDEGRDREYNLSLNIIANNTLLPENMKEIAAQERKEYKNPGLCMHVHILQNYGLAVHLNQVNVVYIVHKQCTAVGSQYVSHSFQTQAFAVAIITTSSSHSDDTPIGSSDRRTYACFMKKSQSQLSNQLLVE